MATSFQPEDAACAATPLSDSAASDAPANAPLPLAELYDAYADFVCRSLLRLGVAPARIEDVMQEVFIIASRHLASFQGTSYKAWLFRVADSMARNVRRAARHVQPVPLDDARLVDDGASPFDQAAQAQQVRLLNDLLDQLKGPQREVLVLAELEQLPHTEIAQLLGIHVNTVANRLNAARSNLERLLRKRESLLASGRR